jgi:hypothetical protein
MVVMAKGNPNWTRSKNEPVAWRFLVCGKNQDGEMVTLGKYQEEREAQSRYNELVKAGYYHNLIVRHLKPEPADSGSMPSPL